MNYVIYTLASFIGVLLYLQLARKFEWIDRPNHRSSHSVPTVLGGGIIIPVGILVWLMIYTETPVALWMALLLLAVVSFVDDLIHIHPLLRLLAHLSAVVAVVFFSNEGMPDPHWTIIIALIILFPGWLNAFNFMDGINGITVAFSLISLLSIIYINQEIIEFVSVDLTLPILLSVMIFGWFNFRKKAVCFAGDVGAISLAFLLGYLLFRMGTTLQTWSVLVLFMVYGIDSAVTIIERLIRGENILQPHRKHLYQLLANERKVSHLKVSIIYGTLQLLINLPFILMLKAGLSHLLLPYFLLVSLILSSVYLTIKVRVFHVTFRKA